MPVTKFAGSSYQKDCTAAYKDITKRTKTYEDDLKRIKGKLATFDKKTIQGMIAAKKKEQKVIYKFWGGARKDPLNAYRDLIETEMERDIASVEKERKRLLKQKQAIMADYSVQDNASKMVYGVSASIQTMYAGVNRVLADTIKLAEKQLAKLK